MQSSNSDDPEATSVHRLLLGIIAALVLVVLLVGSALAFVAFSHRGTPGRQAPLYAFKPGWQLVASPHLLSGQNELIGVSASSDTDAWAVGVMGGSDNQNARQALIEHWDGHTWRLSAHPNPGYGTHLGSVVAISPEDAWAVGRSVLQPSESAFAAQQEMLIEHWDGHTWKTVSAPDPGALGSELFKVVATATNDVWAVGASLQVETMNGGVYVPLIEHWDGRTWQVVSSPQIDASAELLGIAEVSAADIWAVGFDNGPSGVSDGATLIEHWDGTRWRIVTDASLHAIQGVFSNVVALSARDVWVTGIRYHSPNPNDILGLTAHWNGVRWSLVPIQIPPQPQSTPVQVNVEGLAASTAGDLWTVGSGGSQPLYEQWDGTRWQIVTGPTATATCQNYLVDITAIPHTRSFWAVGFAVTSCTSQSARPNNSPLQPLVAEYTP